MKNKLIIIFVLLLLGAGVIGASISLSATTKGVDKTLYSSVVKAGLTGYDRTLQYEDGNVVGVCFFKKSVVNTCYRIMEIDRLKTTFDLNTTIANFEEDMIKRVALRQDSIDAKTKQTSTTTTNSINVVQKK